jgi:hypothetical protein
MKKWEKAGVGHEARVAGRGAGVASGKVAVMDNFKEGGAA